MDIHKKGADVKLFVFCKVKKNINFEKWLKTN